MKESRPFLDSLARVRSELRGSFAARACARAGAVLLAGLAIAGLTDYLIGWETDLRVLLVVALLVFTLVVAIVTWRRASRLPLSELATRSDASSEDPRRSIRSGHDLALESNAEPGSLHAYLTGLALDRAERKLESQVPSQVFTIKERRRLWKPVLWAAFAVVVLVALHPDAAKTIGRRLLHPGTELPPYSPYRFQLSSEGETEGDPRVTYGKAVTLSADIAGPSFDEEVEILLRPSHGSGGVTSLPTFREGDSRYQRTIEGVTEPLDFAFAIGHARSAWQSVELLYQPRLESAEIRVDPPAYSRLNESRFELGAEDLRGLRGSIVRLAVTSNRPLAGGSLTGRAPQGKEILRRVETSDLTGAGPGPNRVEFEWEMASDLVWTLDLVDIQGGRMEEPVLIAQRLIPDEKPKVDLVEPGPVVLATPRSAIDFAWEIEDDLGLERLDFLQGAEKYRDRARPLPEGPGEKRLRLERTMVLSNLGVSPGQTLEFLIEARDRNPSLLGIGSSTAATVQIISELDYAERIRLRTTLEEFSARYRVLRESLERALESLEKLAEAAATGDAGRTEAARESARRAHREAAQWFDAFAKEFPAYATDSQLNELSGELRDELEKNLEQLRDAEAGWLDPASATAMVEALRERLRPGAEKLAEQEGQAEQIAALGRVLEAAAELEAIHDEQREISDRLRRLALELGLGHDENRGDVPALRARQQRNAERLQQVMDTLPEKLDGLPEGFDELKEGAREVLKQLGELQVHQQMDDGARQAFEGKVPGASDAAALALANLDQILARKKDPFCSLCQGGGTEGLGGGPMDGLAREVLSQMMNALRGRARSRGNQGDGKGGVGVGGTGIGGSGGSARGGSGVTMQGIQLDIPLIGPPRVRLSHPPTGGGLPGGDSGASGESLSETGREETLPLGEKEAEAGDGWSPEEVPPRYRDAARRFFSENEDSAETPTTDD